jgi:hypothetical protein
VREERSSEDKDEGDLGCSVLSISHIIYTHIFCSISKWHEWCGGGAIKNTTRKQCQKYEGLSQRVWLISLLTYLQKHVAEEMSQKKSERKLVEMFRFF